MLSGQNQLHKSIITICWPVNGSTYHTGACAPIQLWTPIHDKWTKLDLSNPTSSTCGFRNGGQNRFSICPPFTCENAKVDKSGRFFRIFYFFFYFFSYTPFYLLLCYYPFFTKHPVLSAIMRFFLLFWPLFYTFLHLFTSIQSRAIYPISKPQR